MTLPGSLSGRSACEICLSISVGLEELGGRGEALWGSAELRTLGALGTLGTLGTLFVIDEDGVGIGDDAEVRGGCCRSLAREGEGAAEIVRGTGVAIGDSVPPFAPSSVCWS